MCIFLNYYKVLVLLALTLKEKYIIIIIRDLNIPHSKMDRKTKQKVVKEQVDLRNSINQLDLKEIYKTPNLETSETKFFPNSLECYQGWTRFLVLQKFTLNWKYVNHKKYVYFIEIKRSIFYLNAEINFKHMIHENVWAKNYQTLRGKYRNNSPWPWIRQ